jgi:hypothetical protein
MKFLVKTIKKIIMAKPDCTLFKWGEAVPKVIGNLYQLPKPIDAPSIPFKNVLDEKICTAEEHPIRTFVKGRLIHFDEQSRIASFIGHKIPQPGVTNTKKKYLFTITEQN